jgi:hypothetical protein
VLTLPEGLTARQPAAARQPVQAGGVFTHVRWLIEAAPGAVGPREVMAALEPGGISQRQTLTFLPAETRLALVPRGPFRSGRPFWVSCQVSHPRPGQSVALTLPEGLTLKEGDPAVKPVPAESDLTQILWLVRSDPRTTGRRELTARLLPEGTDARASVEIIPVDLTH